MDGTWMGRADSVSMYVSVGEKEVNHRYRLLLKVIEGGVKIYGYVCIIDSKNLMQIWKVAFYRMERYLKLAK